MILESLYAAPLCCPLNSYGDNGHSVVAENINDLDGDFAPPWRTRMGGARELKAAVFPGAEALPFVLKHIVPRSTALPIHRLKDLECE